MTDEHKVIMAEMIMNDYDIRPSLARFVVTELIKEIDDILAKEDIESAK